jgi:hypothetical protein
MPSFTIASHTRFTRPLIAMALAALLAACGSDNTVTGPRDVTGTYVLATVDGSPLPYTVPNAEHVIVINSATATLGADHSYTVAVAGTEDGTDSEVAADQGTYAVSGSTITFTSTAFGGASYTAAAGAGTYTVTIPGAFVSSSNASFALVFNKQG